MKDNNTLADDLREELTAMDAELNRVMLERDELEARTQALEAALTEIAGGGEAV